MRGKGLRSGRVQQAIQHIIIRKKFTEAGICKRHKDYFFSAYKLNIEAPTALADRISIDNSRLRKHFKSIAQFKKALSHKLRFQKSTVHIKRPNRHKQLRINKLQTNG